MNDVLHRRLNSGRVHQAWVENRSRESWWPVIEPRALWTYRELALFLALRDIKLRYKQTVFGLAWAGLQPLAAMTLVSLFLGQLAHVPSDGLPYPLFVLVGFSVWWYVANSVTAAAQSLVQDEALITKVYFPRILAPVAAVFPGLVDFAVAMALIAGAMGLYGVTPSPALLSLPLWVCLMVLVVLSTGLWLASLNVLYRDARYVLPFLLQIWFLASPVVFPSSIVSGTWEYIYRLNPVVGAVDGIRWAVIGAPPPPLADTVSCAATGALFIGGAIFFQSTAHRFADVV